MMFCGYFWLSLWIAGCATYKGQYDNAVAIAEQCFLRIPASLTLKAFDDTPVSLGWPAFGNSILSIPSGKHSLVFNYKDNRHFDNYENTHSLLSSTEEIMIVCEFVPGLHYQAAGRRSGNKITISVTHFIPGKMYPKYAGKMVIAPDISVTVNPLGSTVITEIGSGATVQFGMALDSHLPITIGLNMGANVDALKFVFITFFGLHAFDNPYTGLGLFAGGLAEFYIPATNYTFGIGAGLTSHNLFADAVPYIRLLLPGIPTDIPGKFNIYIDGYLLASSFSLYAQPPDYLVMGDLKSWGMGVLWSPQHFITRADRGLSH